MRANAAGGAAARLTAGPLRVPTAGACGSPRAVVHLHLAAVVGRTRANFGKGTKENFLKVIKIHQNKVSQA